MLDMLAEDRQDAEFHNPGGDLGCPDAPLRREWDSDLSPSPALVGSGTGEVADAPRLKGDRRLELPFSFTLAA
jgi:hypothetical protein